jgi:hypothetical protein
MPHFRFSPLVHCLPLNHRCKIPANESPSFPPSRLHNPRFPSFFSIPFFPFVSHPSAYVQPNVLLQWIFFMPQLERLMIHFLIPVPNRDVERAERQLTHTQIPTPITLPDLRLLMFSWVSAYFEAMICRITTPRLEQLSI